MSGACRGAGGGAAARAAAYRGQVEIRQLDYFLAVVDHGGITRAASVLHISQPSLSQAIRGLERELRITLFHRVGRGLVLSPSGEALVGPARHAIRSVEQAADLMHRLQRLEGGRVDICALPSLGSEPVAAWVGYLRRQHPAVAVRMEEADDPAGVIESVRSGATELGFVTLPAPLSGLTAQTLSSQYIVLVCPPGWTGTPATPIPIAEIAGIPLSFIGRAHRRLGPHRAGPARALSSTSSWQPRSATPAPRCTSCYPAQAPRSCRCASPCSRTAAAPSCGRPTRRSSARSR